jgi:hypothetical protein
VRKQEKGIQKRNPKKYPSNTPGGVQVFASQPRRRKKKSTQIV